jgi:hypothetical protein
MGPLRAHFTERAVLRIKTTQRNFSSRSPITTGAASRLLSEGRS